MINLNYNFSYKDIVLCGVSGGADSVTLLHLLNKRAIDVGFKLIAVHINHNLRGKDSDDDEKFVLKLCKEWGIECKVYNVDCNSERKKTKESIEQVARRLRFLSFEKAFLEFNANLLCLAHHKNDQAETILMNIIRGSGTNGALGIKQKSNIIRPLLDYSKDEILDYININKLKYVKDKTNDDVNLTRNYFRKIIIPSLEKINSNAQDNICLFGKNLSIDEDYFDSILPKNLVNINKKIEEIYILNDFFQLHKAISFRLIRYALSQLNWAIDINKVHYDAILGLAQLKAGSQINLPHGLVVYKESEQIVIKKINKENIVFTKSFKLGEISVENKIVKIEKVDKSEVNFGGKEKYADLDKIPHNAFFRNRMIGDSFTKIGGGRKKFNDYLTDQKYPLRERDKLVVLASESDILWIVGGEISDKIKIDSETENIIKLVVLE